MPIPRAFADDLPEFEKPIAAKQTLVPGDEGDYSIAHTLSNDPTRVYMDRPSEVTPPVLAHELVHQIQTLAGGRQRHVDINGPITQEQYDTIYGYGGPAGLKKVPSISTLNAEQQANIPRDYMNAMNDLRSKPVTDQTLQQADTLNSAYRRPVQQLVNMARPGNTIDTNPVPPGPPPSALTGMIKPLDAVGGPAMYRRGR